LKKAKNKTIISPKVISDPLYGIIDIRPILPLVETPEFQSLAYKYQLGLAYLIFPSATHTRRAHSLGAYHTTSILAQNWVSQGFIDEDEAKVLSAYALYHDIGHPALSHVTEPLCAYNNDENAVKIIPRLKGTIEKAGVNYNRILKLFTHKDPLYRAVHDKNLGMEKLDYLERDGMNTILARPMGVEYLREHIYLIKNNLAIDEKVVDNAKGIQDFYLKMYKNVYLRKASIIAQRMMQKMVFLLIRSKEITASQLLTMTDFELFGKLSLSCNPLVQFLYKQLLSRHLFKETVVIRYEGFTHPSLNQEKSVVVKGVQPTDMEKLSRSKVLDTQNPKELFALESEVAHIAGIPEKAVLIVPVFSPWRFETQDILIYTVKGKLDSMKRRYPGHFKDMEEIARAYTALRVCTFEEYRHVLGSSRISKKVFELLMNRIE
jgi:HD superfamily phosphohydrolase